MILNRDLLFKYCSGINVETGSMLSYYSFSEVTPTQNHKVFNSLYTTGDNFASGQVLDQSKFPGTSLGVKNNPVSGAELGGGTRNIITGSGYFDGSDFIKIGSGVGTDSWTVFFNYSGISHSVGYEKVLLSSAENTLATSGFSIGLLDNSFVSLKNYNTSGRTCAQLPSRYAGQNIISLSKSSESNIFAIGKHNIHEEDHVYMTFKDEDYKKSNQWYIGGHIGVDNYSKALLHKATGFKGYIDDFVLFSGEMSNPQKERFSNFFSITGYIPSQTGLISGAFSGITSVTTGFGAVGTQLSGFELTVTSLTDKAGRTTQAINKTPVYKTLSGQKILYTTGTQYFSLTGTKSPESFDVFNDQKSRFGLDSLIFKTAETGSKIIEYYSENTNINQKVNLGAYKFLASSGSFNAFKVSSDAVSDSFNVFVSGLYKAPKPTNIVPTTSTFSNYTNGSDGLQTGTFEFLNVMTGQSYIFDPVDIRKSSYTETAHPQSSVGVGLSGSVHGADVVNQTDATTIIPKVNKLVFFHKTPTSSPDRFTSFPVRLRPVYDHDYEVLGSGAFLPVSDFGAEGKVVVVDSTNSKEVLHHKFNHHQDSATTTFDGSGYLDKDVYLDGVKLFSGSDYDKFSGKFRLKKTVPAAGNKDLFFVPRSSNDFVSASGALAANKVTFNSSDKLLSEQVWKDGKRQKLEEEYSKTMRGGSFNPQAQIKTESTEKNHHVFSGSAGTGHFNKFLTSVQDSSV